LEQRLRERIATIGWVRLLRSLPGVGPILGGTIYLEIGEVNRFPAPPQLASYAGLVPTIHASGGKCWHGPTSQASNHYLKWASSRPPIALGEGPILGALLRLGREDDTGAKKIVFGFAQLGVGEFL
jgi:hypothetical protein